MAEQPERPEASESLTPKADESVGNEGEVVDGHEVENRPRDAAGEVIASIQASFSHEGPLPAYQWFRGVEDLAPGSTAKIIDDFTKEREHQRLMQKEAVEIDRESLTAFSKFQMRRIHLAAFIAVVFYAGGFVLILDDKSTQGLFLLIFWTAVLVLAALYGKWKGGGPDSPPPREPS